MSAIESSPVERHFDTHPELERKPSRKLRKNYRTTVLPPGTARGVKDTREVFRGVGSPMRPAHGKGVQGFVRGDRIFSSEDAIWLRAGTGDQMVVAGTCGKVVYNRDMVKLTGAQLREIAAGSDEKAAQAAREIARRKANRLAKKGKS